MIPKDQTEAAILHLVKPVISFSFYSDFFFLFLLFFFFFL